VVWNLDAKVFRLFVMLLRQVGLSSLLLYKPELFPKPLDCSSAIQPPLPPYDTLIALPPLYQHRTFHPHLAPYFTLYLPSLFIHYMSSSNPSTPSSKFAHTPHPCPGIQNRWHRTQPPLRRGIPASAPTPSLHLALRREWEVETPGTAAMVRFVMYRTVGEGRLGLR